jgi:proteasome lid subunit RPN8/RPN11
MSELARRGDGRRESGAFLLARTERRPRHVARIVYFDDLDPDALTGAISIRGAVFARLWDLCAQSQMRVIGDVHTHPGLGVAQSHIDAANPMIARRGHVAIIVPHLAQCRSGPGEVGFHVYQGEHTWTSDFGDAAARRLRRTWW